MGRKICMKKCSSRQNANQKVNVAQTIDGGVVSLYFLAAVTF
jgi:hypothetical protein